MTYEELQKQPVLDIFTATKEGLELLAGPYKSSEEWMIPKACAPLLSSGVTVRLVRQRAAANKGSFVGLAIWKARAA